MKTPFLLYFDLIAGAAYPRTKQSKNLIYKIRSQIIKDKRFKGKSNLLYLIDNLSDLL